MPQKGQITRHEWKYRLIRGSYTLQECLHCPVLKEKLKGHPTQFFKEKKSFKVEPKCITRKKPADGTDSAT
jgi:hypothetical protein